VDTTKQVPYTYRIAIIDWRREHRKRRYDKLGINIRPATPEDVKLVAKLIYMSSLGHLQVSTYDFAFPGSIKKRLEKLGGTFLHGSRNPNHYSKFEVAEIDGRVAASLCTRTNESDSLLTFRKTMLEIGVTHREMLGMLWRIRFYSRAKHHFPRDALIIDNAATFPEFRRMGIANMLIERAIDLGRREGYSSVQLECLVGNTPAQKAYEKVGFQVQDVKTHPSWEKTIGCPGIMKMALEL